jgi:hypothetical protein
MKNILLIIALFTVCVINAQETDVWVFDSESNADIQGSFRSMYWGYRHDNGVFVRRSPFYSYQHTSLGFLASQGWPKDYHEADGWVLLHAFLGCGNETLGGVMTNSAVVLYNRKTGILRLFTMRVNIPSQRTMAFTQLIVSNDNTTGILSTFNTGFNHIRPLDRRNNPYVPDNMIKYFESDTGHWVFADFKVAYDDQLPIFTDRLRFRSRVVDVTYHDIGIDGRIALEHSAANRSNIDYGVQFASSINQYLRSGLDIRENIRRLPSNFSAELTPRYIERLNMASNFIISTGIPALAPWISSVAGIMNFFSGSGTSASVVNYTISGRITGTSRTESDISDFQIRQPGSSSGGIQVINPLYDYPLGTVQIATLPLTVRK